NEEALPPTPSQFFIRTSNFELLFGIRNLGGCELVLIDERNPMRTKVLLALLAVAVTIAVAPVLIAEKTPTQVRADTRVLFDSRPDFAEIQVDGKFIDSAPVENRLSPG